MQKKSYLIQKRFVSLAPLFKELNLFSVSSTNVYLYVETYISKAKPKQLPATAPIRARSLDLARLANNLDSNLLIPC